MRAASLPLILVLGLLVSACDGGGGGGGGGGLPAAGRGFSHHDVRLMARNGLARQTAAKGRLVGGDGLEPPTLSV